MPESGPRTPSGFQIERTLSIWHAINETLLTDPELAADEQVITRQFHDAHTPTPDELLARLIDALVWIERREDEAYLLYQHYRARRSRYTARAALLRTNIFQLLGVLELRSFRANLATARIQGTRPSPLIADPELLPDDCVKIERTPVMAAVREKLEAGEDVPGAVMSNAGETLVVVKV